MSRLNRLAFQALVRRNSRVETVRFGSGYGGWHVPAGVLSSNSVVYSAGVGEDASFDLELIRAIGCDVWAFDPTPRAIEYAKTISDPRFHFLPAGICAIAADIRRLTAGGTRTHRQLTSLTTRESASQPRLELGCAPL